MPVVIVPGPYQGPTRGVGEIRVAGSTARECLQAVEAAHPGFGALVFDGSGELHRFVKLFLNGDQLDGDVLETAIVETDRLEVLAAIAGG